METRRADPASTCVTVVDDAPVLDLHPRPKVVREPKGARGMEPLEVVDDVGRRLVVVADPKLEGELGDAFDRLRRDPRE
jgi:hypothetical protein